MIIIRHGANKPVELFSWAVSGYGGGHSFYGKGQMIQKLSGLLLLIDRMNELCKNGEITDISG
jgi:hypothetical protein